jgi:hypothetical protein
MALVAKTFGDIITFTRSSTGTYFNSSGVLQTAAINAARFDYNPSTLAALGLLIEESRTNSIRNNTMVGAVAGTPGTAPTNWVIQINTTTGLTTQVVGTGTESGITYIDLRVSGTASGAGTLDVFFENASAVAALTGQTWTGSVYTKLQAGSLTGISSPTFRLYEYTSGIVYVTGQVGAIATPTTAGLATQRTSATLTTTGGATTASIRPLINYAIANGAAVDITLRVGLPQLEFGAFATSVIPTTTAALPRSADVASVNTLSPWFNASAGTLYAESSVNYTVPATFFPLAASLNDNSTSNRMEVGYLTSTLAGFEIVTGGATQATLYPATASQIRKTAGAYTVNDFAASTNGSVPVTDTSGTIPTVTRLGIGSRTSGGSVIYLRRIAYYPLRLTNAELQAITA